jgi:PAS domain S-box-containing protein
MMDEEPMNQIDLTDLLARLPGIVYRCDTQHQVLCVSGNAEDLTGYAVDDLLGEGYWRLVHMDDRAVIVREIETAVAQNRPYRCVYRIRTAIDEERWVLEMGQAIIDADGIVTAREGFIADYSGELLGNIRLRDKAEQLAVMAERTRLARELHDSVTQSLYSVTLLAGAGRTLSQLGQFERASQYFEDVLETSQQALREMRLLLYKLRPSALEGAGLALALHQRLNTVERRAGIRHQLAIEGELDLPEDVEEALYYITQEALNNAIKHAFAQEVQVRLHQEATGRVTLEIEDDGRGFDVNTAVASGGLGLAIMGERAAMVGGQVTFKSAVGEGTHIIVTVDV